MTASERTLVRVGTLADLDGDRRIVATVDGHEVVVVRWDGELYAYENSCPHVGGPVCEGKLVPRVEAVVADDGSVTTERFVYGEWRFACPWHGFEFDLKSGVCAADPRYRLRRWTVELRGDEVHVAR